MRGRSGAAELSHQAGEHRPVGHDGRSAEEDLGHLAHGVGDGAEVRVGAADPLLQQPSERLAPLERRPRVHDHNPERPALLHRHLVRLLEDLGHDVRVRVRQDHVAVLDRRHRQLHYRVLGAHDALGDVAVDVGEDLRLGLGLGRALDAELGDGLLQRLDGVAHAHGERAAVDEELDVRVDARGQVAGEGLLRRGDVRLDHLAQALEEREAARARAGDAAVGVVHAERLHRRREDEAAVGARAEDGRGERVVEVAVVDLGQVGEQLDRLVRLLGEG